jgi:hypothetical protein
MINRTRNYISALQKMKGKDDTGSFGNVFHPLSKQLLVRLVPSALLPLHEWQSVVIPLLRRIADAYRLLADIARCTLCSGMKSFLTGQSDEIFCCQRISVSIEDSALLQTCLSSCACAAMVLSI